MRAAAKVRRSAVDGRAHEDHRQDHPTHQRARAAHEEVAQAVEQAVAEVPHAGERGQRVVEADHHAQGGDGIGQHVLAQGAHGHVEQASSDTGADGRVARGLRTRADLGEALRHGTVVTHGEQGARRRDEGRLQRRCSTGQHRDRHQDRQWPHDRPGQVGEDVLLDTRVVQAQAILADPGKLQGGDGGEQVQPKNQQYGPGGGLARHLFTADRLFADGQAHVPAPEDEDRQRKACGKRRERLDAERVEPGKIEGQRRRRRGLAEGGESKPDQHQQLQRHQPVLHGHGGSHASTANPHRQGDEHATGDDVDQQVVRQGCQLLVAGDLGDEQVEEVDRHPREVGQHDGGGDHQTPAADPADHRAEGTGRPGKGRAAVRLRRVQLAVAEGNQQHRQEADDEHRRQVCADLAHGRAERAGQGIDRGDGGNAQHHAGQQAEPAFGQALATLGAARVGRVGWTAGFCVFVHESVP